MFQLHLAPTYLPPPSTQPEIPQQRTTHHILNPAHPTPSGDQQQPLIPSTCPEVPGDRSSHGPTHHTVSLFPDCCRVKRRYP